MESSDLDTIISRIEDPDTEIQLGALKALHSVVSSTQGTVEFKQQDLYDRLEKLVSVVKKLQGDNKRYLFDLMSVMSLFHSDQNVLRYRLNGSYTPINSWGLQYVRKIICCVLDVIYQKLEIEDYTPVIEPIIEFLFSHNAEIEALDFIFEISFLPLRTETNEPRNKMFCADYTGLISKYIDDDNRERIMVYLEEMDKFYHIEDLMIKLYEVEPVKLLVYLLKLNRKSDAIRFTESQIDPQTKLQCLYILARNDIYYETNDSQVKAILSNSFLSENFFKVASSLELLSTQKLDNIFRSIDREKTEAAAIANALIHFAYCRDPVFFPDQDDYAVSQEFANSLKSCSSITTMASVGLINSYSHERVVESYSEFIYGTPNVGAVLALAIASQKHHDLDSENIQLLGPFLSSDKRVEVIAAMLGISLLYAASCSQVAYEIIFPLLSSQDSEIALFSIYVLGIVFACSSDEGVITSCLDVYTEIKNDSPFCNLAILGMALMLAKNPNAVNLEFYSKLDTYTRILSLGLMNLGTGNPKIVDDILTEAFTGDTDALLESLGLISSCFVGMGDGVAGSLIDRICNSSLLLDSPHLKNVFPLCLALLYPSNPKTEVLDSLEKNLSHGEADASTLIAFGIIGTGTRSARILRILDSNYSNVYKDPRALSSLTISQGLVNLGKGLFTLSPFFYEKNVISDRGLIGLASIAFLFIDQTLFPEFSFLSYVLSLSISSKYVLGYEGTCRVGKPVETVGLTGKPNKLSGAVIHTLPIILNSNEKAEAEEKLVTPFVEDVVIKRN